MTTYGPSDDPSDPFPPTRLRVDLTAVSARYRAVFGATATAAEMHAALFRAVVDIPALVSEVDRLWSALVMLRLRHANLTAAARAALAAHRDGEPDPWAYLADELTGAWPLSPGSDERGRG
jgi:hypothetical protein